MTRISATAILICTAIVIGSLNCSKDRDDAKGVRADRKLLEHSKEFEKKIYRVADGVYSAVGYGLANSILIVGKNGLIVVDTMETNEEGREVWREFRKISKLPLKAIIYTHFHPDHIYGAAAYAGTSKPEVYAHEKTNEMMERFTGETAPIIGARSMRMYGIFLDKKSMVNCGIGPFLSFGGKSTLGYIRPTKTVRDRLKVQAAGIRLELIHAPGETDDQIYVWLPDRKILVSADNLYKAFPNLYTIRGTWFRSLKNWYRSVDIIRDLRPVHLVLCHGRPLSGADRIYRIATDYRDAIQFVHDQSLRGINEGMTPDELAASIKLPAHLAASPYLQEFYGKASWSARSMFTGNLGWFSGDSADLQPLPPADQARMMADIAGGEDKLLDHAKKYSEKGNHQAALQLSGYLLRISPGSKKAKEIRVRALTALGERESNPPARHYYLTEAKEIRESFVAVPAAKPDRSMVNRFPLSFFFDSLAVNLDAKTSADVNRRVGIRFTDAGEAFTIILRKGVAEIKPRLLDNLDIQVNATAPEWKEMLAKLRNPVTTLAGFDYPKGNVIKFTRFMAYFGAPKIRLSYEKR